MPETPDFDQIASGVAYDVGSPDPGNAAVIKAALVEIWNARGAADIAKLEADGFISEAYQDDVERALRGLDR